MNKMKIRYFNSIKELERFNNQKDEHNRYFSTILGYVGFSRTKSNKISAKYYYG